MKPNVKLSDFLVARTSLLLVEKTSNANVRKNTQSEVNKVIIGQVNISSLYKGHSKHVGNCITNQSTKCL